MTWLMEEIRLLDCTLRDGGYCNQWNFGHQNIEKIIMGLEKGYKVYIQLMVALDYTDEELYPYYI